MNCYFSMYRILLRYIFKDIYLIGYIVKDYNIYYKNLDYQKRACQEIM